MQPFNCNLNLLYLSHLTIPTKAGFSGLLQTIVKHPWQQISLTNWTKMFAMFKANIYAQNNADYNSCQKANHKSYKYLTTKQKIHKCTSFLCYNSLQCPKLPFIDTGLSKLEKNQKIPMDTSTSLLPLHLLIIAILLPKMFPDKIIPSFDSSLLRGNVLVGEMNANSKEWDAPQEASNGHCQLSRRWGIAHHHLFTPLLVHSYICRNWEAQKKRGGGGQFPQPSKHE